MHTFVHKGITYNVEILFQYTDKLEPKEVIVEKLLPNLNDRCWDDERLDHDIEGNFSPMDAYKLKEKGGRYQYHYEKAMRADLQFPIIIWDGKIVDGLHRLLKSYIQKNKIIKTVELKEMPVKSIIKKQPSVLIVEVHQEIQKCSPIEAQMFYDEIIHILEEKGYYVHMSSEKDRKYWNNCTFAIIHAELPKDLNEIKNIPQLHLELQEPFVLNQTMKELINNFAQKYN